MYAFASGQLFSSSELLGCKLNFWLMHSLLGRITMYGCSVSVAKLSPDQVGASRLKRVPCHGYFEA